MAKWVWWAMGVSATGVATYAAAISQDAGVADTPVWVGAPFATIWPDGGPGPGSLEPRFTEPGGDRPFDWAVDLPAHAGTPVRVFAAPKQAPDLDDHIHAHVADVQPTCGAGGDEGFAGYTVFVDVRHDDRHVGTIAYGFIDVTLDGDDEPNEPSDLDFRGELEAPGRWGAVIGTVDGYTPDCLALDGDDAPGVRLELANASDQTTACFLDSEDSPLRLGVHDYLGYLGGPWTTETRQPCPTGI